MKKSLLIAAVLAVVAGSGYAQGIFTFSASAANGTMKYSTDNTTTTGVSAGNPAQVSSFGQLNITFMAAANGTVLTLAGGLPNFTTAWTQAGQVLHQVAPTPGSVPATTITLPSQAGGPSVDVELEIVGWAGTATSWAQAVQTGAPLLGFTGSALSGGHLGWDQPTSAAGSTNPTPGVVGGTGGDAGLVLAPVPEPTTIALAGLGAAALLMFRRRK